MIICYLNYFYNCYLYPNISAVFIFGYRIFMRLEYQSVWLIKIARPLTLAVIPQLVIVSRKISDIFIF